MSDNLRSITDLPVLTEVPDGTYTVVVDGGVAKLAPYGGGGGAEAIEIIYSTADEETYTCNMTFEEIYEALITGNNIANVGMTMEGIGLMAKSSWWSLLNGALNGANSIFYFTFNFGNGIVTMSHNDEDVIASL